MGEAWIIPFLIVIILLTALWKRLPVYDLFAAGAKNGLQTAVQVLPNLAAMLCAISMMQASGLMDALCGMCAPLMRLMGLPAEVAPLVLVRPLSGSGALAVLEDLLERYGADSRIGLIASTVMGSSETIFYTVCIYLSAIGEKKTGYAIPCSLIGMLAGTWIAGMLF